MWHGFVAGDGQADHERSTGRLSGAHGDSNGCTPHPEEFSIARFDGWTAGHPGAAIYLAM
jgi:hypothetical protein